MGDVGALRAGAGRRARTVAVIVRQEIVLFVMGGIFVVETLSVMLQVLWFKITKRRYGEGRRLFRMAPLHHHFELSGWKETQVVVRFWIITMLLVLIGLSSLSCAERRSGTEIQVVNRNEGRETKCSARLQQPHVLVLGLGESGLAMARWCGPRLRRARGDTRGARPASSCKPS